MIEEKEGSIPETFQRLLFRRQFLLGPRQFTPNQYWSCKQLNHRLYLSVHRDLPVVTETFGRATITLAGLAIDPFNPDHGEADILRAFAASATELTSIIEATTHLAGRWVVIFQDPRGTYLFTDPCGFRQVFYHWDGSHTWCASQPELINAEHGLSPAVDDEMFRFLVSEEFAGEESAWVGTRTIYLDCFHLLPNHYLDVGRLKQVRFYPSKALLRKEIAEIVARSASVLQGIMKGILKRSAIAVPLTAGWDSRVLLAASRELSKGLEYFVDRQGVFPEDHPDVVVPQQLSKALGINFTVRNSAWALPGWFVSLLSRNVTGARVLPKTRMIYHKLVSGDRRIIINGNGAEICRQRRYVLRERNPKDLSSENLAVLLGYRSTLPFVVREIDEWRKGLEPMLTDGFNLPDMLYWEQRLGNWGAQYPAEQDIAVEEISPYNCRLLIDTLFSSDDHDRDGPHYPLYTRLMQTMWPEVLSSPINPQIGTQGLCGCQRISEIKVSVIIPVYNAERFIAQAVESALAQRETVEVILVEDGSPDNSLNICRELAAKYDNVHLFRHRGGRNCGEGASRNLGMKNCSCEYIAFLDADDYFLPNRFESARQVFASNPVAEGVYEAVGIHFEDEQAKQRWQESRMAGVEITTMTKVVPPEELFERLAVGDAGYFSIIGLTIRKSVLERSGYHNERLRLHPDTDFIFRLAAVAQLLPGSLETPVAIRRVHGQNRISAPRTERESYENRRKVRASLYRWCRRNGQKDKGKYIFDLLMRDYARRKPFSVRTLDRWFPETQRRVKLLLWIFEFPDVLLEGIYWKMLLRRGGIGKA